MRVLSLFDGISTGYYALKKAGIEVKEYYASEIDRYAIAVSKYHYPEIKHLGDVREIKPSDLPKIDLLIGGSPCTDLSIAGKRKGMKTKEYIDIETLDQYLELKEQGFEFIGQSYLFWEYIRLLRELKPKYFLLENVIMSKKWRKVFDRELGVPIKINSALVSAQNRVRLYWTNIPVSKLPKDRGVVLADILEEDVEEKYYMDRSFRIVQSKGSVCRQIAEVNVNGNDVLKRVYDINFKSPSLTTMQGGHREPKILVDREKAYCLDANYHRGTDLNIYFNRKRRQIIFELDINSLKVRKLTPVECERLQTLPDNYTKYGIFDGQVREISDSQRYRMLGNGWTAEVIVWIFSFLKEKEKKEVFKQCSLI